MIKRPDPLTEIRMTTLHAIRGANYWSRDPVIRMDLAIGAYEDLSSAEVPSVTEQLVAALPGLEEHRCSLGVRGGFVTRLRRGTYAAHIVEHVAIELQDMVDQGVSFGRTRGTGTVGEYTLVFEYAHEAVALRAAALALDTVQQAFAGTLRTVEHAAAELCAIAETPPITPLHQQIFCGITGGTARDATRDALLALGVGHASIGGSLIVDVSPGYIVQAGLPYSHSEIAIILDTTLTDVTEWYGDPERAARLVTVVAEAVSPEGCIVCPDDAHDVHDMLKKMGHRFTRFVQTADPVERARRAADAAATCLAQAVTIRETVLDER